MGFVYLSSHNVLQSKDSDVNPFVSSGDNQHSSGDKAPQTIENRNRSVLGSVETAGRGQRSKQHRRPGTVTSPRGGLYIQELRVLPARSCRASGARIRGTCHIRGLDRILTKTKTKTAPARRLPERRPFGFRRFDRRCLAGPQPAGGQIPRGTNFQ